jgi:hypothetical protein
MASFTVIEDGVETTTATAPQVAAKSTKAATEQICYHGTERFSRGDTHPTDKTMMCVLNQSDRVVMWAPKKSVRVDEALLPAMVQTLN